MRIHPFWAENGGIIFKTNDVKEDKEDVKAKCRKRRCKPHATLKIKKYSFSMHPQVLNLKIYIYLRL